MRVYIATSLANYEMANLWAYKLREAHYDVASQWHELVSNQAARTYLKPRDPISEAERAAILKANIHDLVWSDVVLAITQDDAGKATYCEIGYALALGMRVIWLQYEGSGRNIFDSCSLVTRTTDPMRVMPELRRIEFAQQATIYDSTEEQ